MSCFKPLVFEKLGFTANGKDNLKIVRRFSGNYEYYRDSKKYVMVPCGQCLGCRLDYANHWAERCCLEASKYDDNMFLTLTYSDEFLPNDDFKKDFKLFIKRLRYYFKDRSIRFFGCFERGQKSGRPHFHIIIFNAKFDDLKKLFKSGKNYIFTSKELEKLWPYGFSTIGEVSYNSINYTARYVLKKIKGQKTDEFLLMSRNPGIGSEFYQENKEKIKSTDLIYFPFSEKKKQCPLSRYYKKLILKDDENYFNLKKDELLTKLYNKVDNDKQLYNLDTELKLNVLKENLKKDQIKALKRNL